MHVEWQTAPLGPELPIGDAHVWVAQAWQEPRGLNVLSGEERAYAATFRFEEDRRRWATSRVLVRHVLGRYLSTSAHLVELATVARGRPVVRRPEHSDWLSFSYSRSSELCVVAVTRDGGIGVDIERVRPDHDVVAIARRALGDDVAAHLEALPDVRRVDAFYRAWVREEAKGKCRGTGLVEPDDAARRLPLFVTDLALRDEYAGALASDARPEVIRGCATDV